MTNGSFDADCAVRLAMEDEAFSDLAACNQLVADLTAWLHEERKPWPAHFSFKGKTFEGDLAGISLVARYYVALAKAEHDLRDLCRLPNIRSFEVDLSNVSGRGEALEAFAQGLGCPRSESMAIMLSKLSTGTVPAYRDGNQATDLMFNYAVSIVQRVIAASTECALGFPPYPNYTEFIASRVEKRKAYVEAVILETVQRRAALLLRLRYDALQEKIKYLEAL